MKTLILAALIAFSTTSFMKKILLLAFIFASQFAAASQWVFLNSVDEMTQIETPIAVLESDSKPHASTFGKKVRFIMFCDRNYKPTFRINWQTYIDDDAFQTKAKFDDDPIVELWAQPSTEATQMFLEGVSNRIFLSNGDAPKKYLGIKNTKATTSDLARKFSETKRAVFRQADYRGTEYTAVFDFSDWSSASKVLEKCVSN